MLTHSAAVSKSRHSSLLRSLRRAGREGLGETTLIMARRELARSLPAGGAGLGLCAGLVAAVGLALLIPLHRAYGETAPQTSRPTFYSLPCSSRLG